MSIICNRNKLQKEGFTKTVGSAYTARIVEDEMGAVMSHLSEAIENVKNAITTIESTEPDAAFKIPNLESLKGLMEVGFLASSASTQEWTRLRQECEKSERGF